MRSRIAVFILLACGLVFALLFGRQLYMGRDIPRAQFVEKKLRVLTYSTFVGATGPGSEIIKRFKAENNCDVELLTAGDAGLLLERFKLSQASAPFDVVLGLDQLLLESAKATVQWRPIQVSHEGWSPEAMTYEPGPFVPFEWSTLTFIYRQDPEIEPPQSFSELILPKFALQIALQDPHSSSPGKQFLGWVRAMEGEKTVDFLTKLKPNVQSVSPSWAFSYGLFKKKQAVYVFSYITSLAFHWGLEGDRSFQSVSFTDGHPVQVEYAGVPQTCRECDLAEKFVQMLLQPWAQKLIMEKNFMFPVLHSQVAGTIFEQLPQLPIRPSSNPSSKDLSDWEKVFKR